MLAFLQSEGIHPWFSDDWKMRHSTSVISLEHIFSNRPGMPSGPVALFSFKLFNSLRTPNLFTILLGMWGLLEGKGWVGVEVGVVSGFEITLQNRH